MMGTLKSLGIEKGKPFAPAETVKRAMRQTAINAWFLLQWWFNTEIVKRVYWPDRHYVSLLQTDANRRLTFTYDDRIDLTDRAAEYFWCTYMPKVLGDALATQYLMALADNNGNQLEAGKLYKVAVPAQMPVTQFWALTCYDRATNAFIYSQNNRTTLSSYDLAKMKRNVDGSVTIYFGPNVHDGLESKWLPTAGKRPMPAMRFYGAAEALNNRSFKMNDFKLVVV